MRKQDYKIDSKVWLASLKYFTYKFTVKIIKHSFLL